MLSLLLFLLLLGLRCVARLFALLLLLLLLGFFGCGVLATWWSGALQPNDRRRGLSLQLGRGSVGSVGSSFFFLLSLPPFIPLLAFGTPFLLFLAFLLLLPLTLVCSHHFAAGVLLFLFFDRCPLDFPLLRVGHFASLCPSRTFLRLVFNQICLACGLLQHAPFRDLCRLPLWPLLLDEFYSLWVVLARLLDRLSLRWLLLHKGLGMQESSRSKLFVLASQRHCFRTLLVRCMDVTLHILQRLWLCLRDYLLHLQLGVLLLL
mmetsp:Transcript_36653/g.84525  ORF Transcript_36653/g.84525 Transcript_36653/m.84525 type:complete len:262 (+) Transcript_36653:162-947(+)